MFRNGYGKNKPTMKCLVEITQGYGKSQWGADPDKEYYILKILKVMGVKK